MPNSVAADFAAAYTRVIRYAAEKQMSTLDAMVQSARDGEENGDALPRKVLADYLEENPHFLHDDETLQHLRAEPEQHEHGVNIHQLDGGKIVARPHLQEPLFSSGFIRLGELTEADGYGRQFRQADAVRDHITRYSDFSDTPWEDLDPWQQEYYAEHLSEIHRLEVQHRELLPHQREAVDEMLDGEHFGADVESYAEALRRAIRVATSEN